MATQPTVNREKKNQRNETRGSGLDPNSDAERLVDRENSLDKANEDSFPASDPPSATRTANWRDKKSQH